MTEKKQMNECICTAMDGRGRSPCGVRCPAHPLTKMCIDCKEKEISDSPDRCWPCQSKWNDANRPKSCKHINKAYVSIIDSFHALERMATSLNPDPIISKRVKFEVAPGQTKEEYDEQAKKLREVWHWVIEKMHVEYKHHNWFEE